MAKVKTIERIIWENEGFDIRFVKDGKDVRGDLSGLPQNYNYLKRAKGTMNVSQWKEKRFHKAFPGYDVEVLDGNGNVVDGHTRLSTVRESYIDESED